MIYIHDPIHGTIEVSLPEIKLIDSRAFQRLRYIKQLGFSDLAFPGATHSRYAHSLGAMHMATRMVRQLLAELDLEELEKERIIQTVRLAVLFHDLGHPPMSHISERVMGPASALDIDEWLDTTERQASHEDYTIKFMVDSELTELIEQYVGHLGIQGRHLAALMSGKAPECDAEAFQVGVYNLLPMLSQIVSSELDADRMDYLLRDTYYCGVSYGNFDHTWLINNLRPITWEGQELMALQHKGVWAFENFLLARFHMFLAVYYHHTSVCFDHLLSRYYESGEYYLPTDIQAYLDTDDVHLMAALRKSQNKWAQKVVARRAYRLLVETHNFGKSPEDAALDVRLKNADIDFFRVKSKGTLSKYFKKRDKVFPLLVFEPELDRVSRIEEYTPLYKRFDDVVALSRVYCQPERYPDAQRLLVE